MIGSYDFCGHYEWTFEWLRRQGGEELVRDYWATAIGQDSQKHAEELICTKGFSGMVEYWGHTLAEEKAGYEATMGDDVYRVDMHECPSKGFLLRNGLKQYNDYCDHCMGWVGPLMKRAGFHIHHEHNHCGQCWWEIRRADDETPASAPGALAGETDVRVAPGWAVGEEGLDVFRAATRVEDKIPTAQPPEDTKEEACE